MLVCPSCNTEHRKSATVCKQCGTQLSEQSIRYAEDVPTCSNCGTEVSSRDQFCQKCGVLQNAAFTSPCQIHRDRASTGMCVLCRKELCGECALDRYGRIRCEEHVEVKIVEEWAAVLESCDGLEASYACHILESEGIPAHRDETGCSQFFFPSLSDHDLSGWAERRGVMVKVFVEMVSFRKAVDVLRAHGLLFKYECGHCGHRFNEDSMVQSVERNS